MTTNFKKICFLICAGCFALLNGCKEWRGMVYDTRYYFVGSDDSWEISGNNSSLTKVDIHLQPKAKSVKRDNNIFDTWGDPYTIILSISSNKKRKTLELIHFKVITDTGRELLEDFSKDPIVIPFLQEEKDNKVYYRNFKQGIGSFIIEPEKAETIIIEVDFKIIHVDDSSERIKYTGHSKKKIFKYERTKVDDFMQMF